MAKHDCASCRLLRSFQENGDRTIHVCVFDQSENYLQEVLLCSEDCELDDFAEYIYGGEENG